MRYEALVELHRLFNRLENSADNTGCSGDLTVVELSALEALSEAFGTWPELDLDENYHRRDKTSENKS